MEQDQNTNRWPADSSQPQAGPEPLLFQFLPGLSSRLAWTSLTRGPTPVHPLEKISGQWGHEVWIKRDDLTTSTYGGNKPRKLEFLLARAKAAGKKKILTAGGIGSNHALATTYFGRRMGFEVILDLCQQPVTEHVQLNLKLFHALGARMNYCGSQPGLVVKNILAGRLRHPQAFYIPLGGSDFFGTLGYIEAGLELTRQVKQKELPCPETIFTAAGSGGTMAGLILGLKLGGLPARVTGVRVAAAIAANPWHIARLARSTLKGLRRLCPVPACPSIEARDAEIITSQYGPGYGHPTRAGQKAARIMTELENIRLDLTYTAKTFAALEEYIRVGRVKGPVLFLNTYSANDLAHLAANTIYQDLPPAFHQFFL